MEENSEGGSKGNKNWAFPVLFTLGILAFLWLDPASYLLGESSSEDSIVTAPGIGDTLTTDNGVSVALSSVSYAAESPNTLLVGAPLGEWVAVSFVIENDSSESLRFSTNNIEATIGGSTYEATGLLSREGASLGFSEQINPGLSLAVVTYFDVPKGSLLDTFEYDPRDFGAENLVFYVSE